MIVQAYDIGALTALALIAGQVSDMTRGIVGT